MINNKISDLLQPYSHVSIVQKLMNCSPDSKQPRSCLRTSLREEQPLVDEPEAAWTCRKLHHRAEVATAVGAGTN